jgi:DNA ligase-1
MEGDGEHGPGLAGRAPGPADRGTHVKRFAALFSALDSTTGTLARTAAMRDYFAAAAPADAAWASYLLAGGKPRQAVPTRVLREAAQIAAGIEPWLFDECYAAVGDLAETIALLLPDPVAASDRSLAHWVEQIVLPLRGQRPEVARARLVAAWEQLTPNERFVFNKLVTGSLRIGVARGLLLKALAAAHRLDEKLVAERLVGYTDTDRLPDAERFAALVAPAIAGDRVPDHQPYPFFLAQPLAVAAGKTDATPAPRNGARNDAANDADNDAANDAANDADNDADNDNGAVATVAAILGVAVDWQAEWKWDGIRAQLVRRAGRAWLWSRGEDLITERFPEIERAALALPDGTVLDGEVLAWDPVAALPRPFAALQTRIGRKRLSDRVLAATPAVLLVYDLLEVDGIDWRQRPLAERRQRLERLSGVAVVAGPESPIALSPLVVAADWAQWAALRAQSRARGVEGLMIKRRDSTYGIGRSKGSARGEWWKWKIDPLTVDAVMVYAQAGHGRRASLYTDYTFAVWGEGGELIPFAKAYSGLTDAELHAVDAIVRRTTAERFGPVRQLRPTQVFELGFEGIQRSPRHKSGIAVRFPRILRWRRDKRIEDADTLATLQAML